MENRKSKINWVYVISLIISIVLTVWAVVLPDNFNVMADTVMAVVTGDFGWLYMIGVGAFLFFSVWLGFSKYGSIKLGPDDSEPEYSTLSWFAMLFSSGMGIGLVFWGVAEPLSHYMNPLGAEPGTPEAAQFAMGKSLLHWCLHPWACFCVIGLGLAYMQFRKNQPGLISRLFVPLFGEEKINGWLGTLIDVLAVFATIAGVCTSLGLGTMQINAGLSHLFGIPNTKVVQAIIIIVISILFVSTAVAGIEKGISVVSNINMVLAVVLMVLCFIIGPTVFELNIFSEGIGLYLKNLIPDSFAIGAFENNEWYGSWTIFYWAWWVAWAPFCGSFIARISRGRTIREFVAGVLIVPAILSFMWFSIFGGMGLNLGTKVAELAAANKDTACFVVFSEYPLGMILSGITIILVATFFITSANSATFVLGIFTSEGNLNPSKKNKLIWGVIEVLFALVLMLVSANGLNMMQSISIAGAFPFLLVMIVSMFAIVKSLQKEKIEKRPCGIEMQKEENPEAEG